MENMGLTKRKGTRLPAYDYSKPGAYFVTVCTHNRECLLSQITPVGEGLAPPAVHLTEIGKIVEEEILALEVRFPAVKMNHYVIMPNHIHLLLTLQESAGGASPSPTVTSVIGTMKSVSTIRCHKEWNDRLSWQRSFYDHVIRNERDYQEIWKYIEENPAKWTQDRFFTTRYENS